MTESPLGNFHRLRRLVDEEIALFLVYPISHA